MTTLAKKETRTRARKPKRVKAPPQFIAQHQFEQAVDTIAQLQLDLEMQIVQCKQDKQALLERYGVQIKSLKADIKEQLALCSIYATEHRKTLLPGPKKSGYTALAIFGFRLGQPKVETRSKWTWKKVTAAIKERGWLTLLKITYTPEHAAIRKACSHEELKEIGLIEVQEEAFFVEAKTDTDDQPKTTSVNGKAR